MDRGAGVGLRPVFGIAARHTIRLIRRLQHLERQTPEADAADLVVRGARDELAPTLLTTLCTGLLFLPFVLRGDLPGNEIVNPMGAVVIGGLATAAVVNLFLVPALYLRFHKAGDDGEELDLRDLWEGETPVLNVIRSKSVPQLSSIDLIFKPGANVLHARQWVQEKMAEVVSTLPNWAGPPVMIQPLSSTSRVMKIGLQSKSLNLMQMSMMSYWTIRARLLRLPGVANVPIWGERLQLMQVQVDPDRLHAHDVTLDNGIETTAEALDSDLLTFSSGASVVGTGGFLEGPNQRLNVQHVLPITTANDMAQIVIEQQDGKPLRLGDVADVLEAEQPLIGDAVINRGPGLMMMVQK